MLFLVGLGLGNGKDITLKGLEVVKKVEKVYLEAYTSVLTCGKEELEAVYEREVFLADRYQVEQESETILDEAASKDVAFLVVGDPFGATTHTDLALRAQERGIQVQVVHNASILNAVGCCGLQLYSFGETVSIVIWTDDWKPDSFYDKIVANKRRGLHTLCLLDIKIKEQTVENMMRGKKIYEPARFLTVNDAIKQLLDAAERQECEGRERVISKESLCVALARVGWESQKILAGSLATVSAADLGPPLHSLIIPGQLHFLELDMLRTFAADLAEFDRIAVCSK